MASSPIKSPNASMATKDAMFLFDLFRESPTPILIQIGPYAAKTGAKPNTIIKRIAGIKARNGLNISTTLGNYKAPAAAADDGKAVAETKPKTPKKEQPAAGSFLAKLGVKQEMYGAMKGSSAAFGTELWDVKALPTPVASPSSSNASGQSFYQQHYVQPYQQSHHAASAAVPAASPQKRNYEEMIGAQPEEPDLEGTPWKMVKGE